MFIGDGLSVNSGFMKILCAPEKPLALPKKVQIPKPLHEDTPNGFFFISMNVSI